MSNQRRISMDDWDQEKAPEAGVIYTWATTFLLIFSCLFDVYLAMSILSPSESLSIGSDLYYKWGQSIATLLCVIAPGLFHLLVECRTKYVIEESRWDGEERKLYERRQKLLNKKPWPYDDFRYLPMPIRMTLSVTRLRIVYESFLTLMTLKDFLKEYNMRETGAWKDCVMIHIVFHSLPQAVVQCLIVYYAPAATVYGIFDWQGDDLCLVSVGVHLAIICLKPDSSPCFEKSHMRRSQWCCKKGRGNSSGRELSARTVMDDDEDDEDLIFGSGGSGDRKHAVAHAIEMGEIGKRA